MSLATYDENDLEGHIEDMDVGSSMHRSSKDYLDEKMYLKANLVESIHDFCQSLSPSFWNNLHSCTLNRLANILAQSVRYSVFQTRDLHVEKTAFLCSEWVVEVLKLICLDDIHLQSFFDLLLSEGEHWPLWLKPAITDEIELKHQLFVAFVDRLILNLGFSEVILGIPGNLQCATSQSIDITSAILSLSRAWVAAELLCSWTWKGGCALKTFLPSLVRYMKEESCPEVSIVSLLLDTLLGGTLIHESDLRALVALLFTTNTKDYL